MKETKNILDWNEETRNQKDFEKEFNEQKSRYNRVTEIPKEKFKYYKMELVFNELSDLKEFYLLLNPSLASKPIYDNRFYSNFLSKSRVEYENDKDFLINPSFIKQYVHYKTFKYVLNRILNIKKSLLDNVLYDNPTLPIIDKPELIDLDKIKNLRPNRFPCNFEKVYNESDFSKYLQVHYHKIKNCHNLSQINKLNKPIFEPFTKGYFIKNDKGLPTFVEEKFVF